jgi:hypothetical protein
MDRGEIAASPFRIALHQGRTPNRGGISQLDFLREHAIKRLEMGYRVLSPAIELVSSRYSDQNWDASRSSACSGLPTIISTKIIPVSFLENDRSIGAGRRTS